MKRPQNKLLIALAILITFGLGLWLVLTQINTNPPSKSQSTPLQSETTETPKAGRIEISYSAEPGISSLEQLKKEARDVVVLNSEYGKFVDSIEGHKGGTEGKYWSFYVNSKMSEVGADSYIQKEGDTIEWKFQKL